MDTVTGSPIATVWNVSSVRKYAKFPFRLVNFTEGPGPTFIEDEEVIEKTLKPLGFWGLDRG